MSIDDEIKGFLKECRELSSFYNETLELKDELLEVEESINRPLRVAIVGVTKAGKSTLMNAIMREKLLITGKMETTYTVTWFKYGTRPSLTIKLRNGREISAPVEELAKWSDREKLAENPLMNDVEYVVINYPNEFLKKIELIDTPGLRSTYKVDSDNTKRMLGLKTDDEMEKEAEDLTNEEASKADAIVYAFYRSIDGNDEELLNAFKGEDFSGTSPINAVGVLTQVDRYWNVDKEDPMNTGREVVKTCLEKPEITGLLYNIYPVNGIVVEGIHSMKDEDWNIIKKLAKLKRERLLDILFMAKDFCNEEFDDLDVSPKERSMLYKRFQQYGVYSAVEAARQGMGMDEAKTYIFNNSGIPEFLNIIEQHFGNRSQIIKLMNIIKRIRSQCYNLKNRIRSENVQIVCSKILDACEKLEIREHIFNELEALKYYYTGQVRLTSEEKKDLLNITGEYGYGFESRLGVNIGTSISEMIKVARKKANIWNIKSNDFGITSCYEIVARTLGRSYELIYHYLACLE